MNLNVVWEETMYSRGTKISVSVLDLNVIKITTTARHNFG